MRTADDILKDNLKRVMAYGRWDTGEDVRPRWSDGTPAHTQYIGPVINYYDIRGGIYPLTTFRPVAWKSAIKEILWIYQDKTNSVDILEEKYGVKYWNSWKNKDGDLGTAYGHQIAKQIDFPEGSFNQIDRVIHLLKNDPYNRRIMTNMINMEEMKDMTLVPCAFMTMWIVRGKFLDMTLIQRSNDIVAAQSINALQYSALLMMIASVTGYEPGIFTHFIQNMHLYDRHHDIAREMLSRKSMGQGRLVLQKREKFEDFKIEDFSVEDYFPHPQIKNIPIAI